jgi:hypothetical protein
MINELGTGSAVDIYTEAINVATVGNEETETQYADEDVFALFRDENIMEMDNLEPVINDQTFKDTNMPCLEGPTHCQDGLNEEEGEESDS